METSRGSCPSWPFDKHSGGFWSKARRAICWALGQAYRKVNHMRGCSWSRHWSGRGCREEKRRAILGGLTTQGSWLRELVCLLICWLISTLIWAIWILFFHFRIWKVFSPNERRIASWMGLGMLKRLMEATPAFICCLILFGGKGLKYALWQRLSRNYSFLSLICTS